MRNVKDTHCTIKDYRIRLQDKDKVRERKRLDLCSEIKTHTMVAAEITKGKPTKRQFH